MVNSKAIYFPNLNALRFIAAFIVIIHHIEQTKSQYNIPNLWTNQAILNMGKTGVILFFVLSGFLITYLLLNEKLQSGEINIPKFYIRRILRIWPLYYIIVFIVFFILPYIVQNASPISFFIPRLIAFTFISANVAMALFGPTFAGTHLWSVSTEEHFYLIWPMLVKTVSNKLALFIGVIVLFLAVKFIAAYFLTQDHPFRTYMHHFCIDCMAIGGLFAYLLFSKSKLLNILFNKYLFYSVIIITLFLILKGTYIPAIQYEVFAVLFAVIIINLAANKIYSNLLENKIFLYLGKISYGLYMYHPIMIILCVYALKKLAFTNNLVIYSISILSTFFIAAISYELIESKILSYKKKFMIIKT